MATFPDTPATLLARLAVQATGRSTEESDWAELFDLYAPAIRRFAENLGAGGDSEDIVQDIFMKLVTILRDGHYCAEAGRFRCYLATLIRNELVSRWRKAQVRAQCVSLESLPPDEQPEVQPNAAAVVEAKWRLARHEAAVWHALTKTALSKQSREIYRAHALEERPIGEVAARFGVSRNVVAQVKARVNRMIATLESRIKD
jgi:RNA polymerase sigma factor (sigma-70 family)